MKLRSRNIRGQLNVRRTARIAPNVSYKEERPGETDESMIDSSHDSSHSDEEVPMARARPPVAQARRGRRRAVLADRDVTDLDFKTPVRVRPGRVLSEVDPGTPRNHAVRSIYSPVVRFLTPNKENSRTPSAGSVLMSPPQCMFGFGSVNLLEDEDEDNDDVFFSPFSFIKNIPEQPQSKASIRDIPPKTRSTPQATLILDLDETLVYSSLTVIEDAEYTFRTSFQNNEYKVYVILRPHVKDFLQAMSKVFEMFVYTCAKKDYAGKILNILDPRRKLFRHQFYQDDCTCVLGHYVKDLGLIERDLAKTVVLDNAPHTYPYHLMNTLPIKSWSGDKDDKELLKLIPYLERLSGADDFRGVLKRRTDHFHRLLSED